MFSLWFWIVIGIGWFAWSGGRGSEREGEREREIFFVVGVVLRLGFGVVQA